MASEVTVSVDGTGMNLALFIREIDWTLSLPDLRSIIAEQELDVPENYRFLTKSGNAISTASESSLRFTDVAFKNETEKGRNCKSDSDIDEKRRQEMKTEYEDEMANLAKTEEKLFKGNPPSFIIHIQPANVYNEFYCRGFGAQTTGNPSLCPFTFAKHSLKDFMEKHANPAALIKIALALMVVCVGLAATLACTAHILLGLTGSFVDQSNKMFGESHSTGLEIENLRTKLTEIQVAHKYEHDALKNSIRELEDLYLRDVGKLREELAIQKQKLSTALEMASRYQQMRNEMNELAQEMGETKIEKLTKEEKKRGRGDL